MSTTLTLQGTTSSPTAFGTATIGPIYFTGTTAITTTTVNLVSGPNQIGVPSGAIGCIVSPPTTNTIQLRYQRLQGINGTVTLTVGATIVTAVAIGTAGTGYPASANFLATPFQSGGSGCLFMVTTNSSGVPTTLTFLTGFGGTGYTAATVPWYSGSFGVPIPETSPYLDVFDTAYSPSYIYVTAASATTGYTSFTFF